MKEADQFLSCPHCLSHEVPRGARVCKGCYAEVHYGPSSASKKMVLIGSAIAAWFIGREIQPLLPTMDAFGLWLIVFFVVWAPSRYLLAKKQADKVMFLRNYISHN